MYSKQEKAQLSEAFWTAFGRYMAPHLGAGGEKVNWINYKTKVRHIAFRTEVINEEAIVSIALTHPSVMERELAWQQLVEVQHLLEAKLQETWTWEKDQQDEFGHTKSIVYTSLPQVSILKQEDWPALISFFKPRLIALDAFWDEVKFGFEA